MSMLELRRVSKVYGQGTAGVHALADVSLPVDEGSMVAVIGPSGSGKSTLLSIAGSLEEPTGGEVLAGGQSLSRMSRNARARLRRRVIGYVFQDFNVLPGLTAAENVSLPLELDGLSARKARAAGLRALERLGLGDRAAHYPDQLSGGEQQRVAATERPAPRMPGGGAPARRAVIRWAIRLLRREWRQQLLILALITVAVGATVVASTVATDSQSQIAGVFGTAQDGALISGPPATINAGIRKIESLYGTVDVIENEGVQIPGSVSTFDLRAQDPHGPFGGPMLSLVSGQYPATANQIAVTSGVAAGFRLSVGSDWTVAGKTRKVTGIVQDPQNLAGEFALVIPGQVTAPDDVSVLFDAPGATAGSIQSRTGLTVYTAHTVANTKEINPETISITATQRHIGLVVRANGAATGITGAVAGLVTGFLAWLAYRPHAEISADQVMGTFQMPWTVIVISMVLAVIATYFAASRPAMAIARTPVVAALAGRPPAPAKAGKATLIWVALTSR